MIANSYFSVLFRHLPRNYTKNSIYAMFPFIMPEAMKTNLTKLGVADKYDFTRHGPAIPSFKSVNTIASIRSTFQNFNSF